MSTRAMPKTLGEINLQSAAELRRKFNKLKTLRDTALANDREELDYAKKSLTGGHCKDKPVFNSDAIQGDVQAIENRLNQIFTELESPSSVARFINMRGYVDNICTKVAPGWESVIGQLNEVRGEMDRLGIHDWEGSAGDAYRGNVQDQGVVTDSHIGLAMNAHEAIGSVALLQAYIVGVMQDALDYALNYGGIENTVNKPPASFGVMEDTTFDFLFYTRTASMISACFEPYNLSLRLNMGEPWRNSAEQIDEQLGIAIHDHDQGNLMMTGGYTPDDVEIEGDYDDGDGGVKLKEKGKQ